MAIVFENNSFCITGKFETINKESEKEYTRTEISLLIEKRNGIIKKSVLKTLDYLVVGGLGSTMYSSGLKGNKIIKAESQENTRILTEKELLKALDSI